MQIQNLQGDKPSDIAKKLKLREVQSNMRVSVRRIRHIAVKLYKSSWMQPTKSWTNEFQNWPKLVADYNEVQIVENQMKSKFNEVEPDVRSNSDDHAREMTEFD